MLDNKKSLHLLFAPDGNRRFSQREGITISESYQRASLMIDEFIDWFFERDHFDEVSMWLLSEYNLGRDPDCVKYLTRSIVQGVKRLSSSRVVGKYNLQVNVIGELDSFSEACLGVTGDLESLLSPMKTNSGKKVNLLIAYNGDKEMLKAIRKCEEEGLDPTPTNFERYWSIPSIDIYMRTGQLLESDECVAGNRLSGHFPGIHQAKLISTPLYPLELTKEKFYNMIEKCLAFQERGQ